MSAVLVVFVEFNESFPNRYDQIQESADVSTCQFEEDESIRKRSDDLLSIRDLIWQSRHWY